VINLKKIFILFIIISVTGIKVKAEINDSIFATVGNKVITRSDIVNEIKIILIFSGQEFSEERLEALQAIAVKDLVKRNVKKIEIKKYNNLQFNPEDLFAELDRLAKSINIDVETLKNTLVTNGINYETLVDIYKTELLWNSLIFDLYKNTISINNEEIDEQIKLIENKKTSVEYLVSEIIVHHVNKAEFDNEVKKIKSAIELEGFENTALKLSISESAIEGGDIGWVNESAIPKNLKDEMERVKIGEISQAVILPEGILFFKIRDKKNIENIIDLDEAKNQLIKKEKANILNMHSLSHYDKLRRTVTIKYY